MLSIKRIYQDADKSDGYRVLVDRLWPRGVSKQRANIDLWLKDIAPTPELRAWFAHDPKKFKEFSVRYEHELEQNPSVVQLAKIIDEQKDVTLLYGAKDPEVNQAVVLKHFMQNL